MAGKQNFESLLEYIVNGEQAKAEELFHQLVVAKSREIYENLLDEEMEEEEMDEASDEEEMDEASEEDEDLDESTEEEEMDEAADEDEDMEEMFNFEGDDEGEDDDAVGGDGDASDMEDELGPDGETDDDGMEFGDHDEEGEEATIMDLKNDIEELKDMFQKMLDAEHNEEENEPGVHGEPSPLDSIDGDMGDEDESMMMPFEEEIESIDLSPAALMREYVDKIGGNTYNTFGKMGDNGANSKSVVASKNDMGGTAKNIAQGGTEKSPVEANKGDLKGNGVMGGKPKDMNTGNVNKVGGTNVKQFYKANSKGHGAEKKGAGEVSGTDKKSLFK
jgi:hypothetical protein